MQRIITALFYFVGFLGSLMRKMPPDLVRRKTQGPIAGASEAFDTFTDVEPIKLRYWAAICLEFNFAEQTLTEALSLAIGLNPWLSLEVTSRIPSIEAKVDIIKPFVRTSGTLRGKPADAICHSLGFFKICKTYRDVIAHTVIHGPKADIVYTYSRQGEQYEADISEETLGSVYNHVLHAGLEITHAFRMIEYHFGESELTPEGQYDPEEIRESEKFQLCLTQLLHCQQQRKSLPPIPEFPQGHLPYPDWAKDLHPPRSD